MTIDTIYRKVILNINSNQETIVTFHEFNFNFSVTSVWLDMAGTQNNDGVRLDIYDQGNFITRFDVNRNASPLILPDNVLSNTNQLRITPDRNVNSIIIYLKKVILGVAQ